MNDTVFFHWEWLKGPVWFWFRLRWCFFELGTLLMADRFREGGGVFVDLHIALVFMSIEFSWEEQ